MGKGKTYSGYTEKTINSIIMDSGAFFKNFDVETDTYDSAVQGGKLIGATRGGGGFTAKATYRTIEIDGVKGAAKGLQALDAWEVTIQANVLEIKKETIQMALGTGIIEETDKYTVVSARNYVEDVDYIENITWVGRINQTEEPIVIQIYNAFSTDGFAITTKDKGEAVISLKFTAHYDAENLDNPPFKIYYPKVISAR